MRYIFYVKNKKLNEEYLILAKNFEDAALMVGWQHYPIRYVEYKKYKNIKEAIK